MVGVVGARAISREARLRRHAFVRAHGLGVAQARAGCEEVPRRASLPGDFARSKEIRGSATTKGCCVTARRECTHDDYIEDWRVRLTAYDHLHAEVRLVGIALSELVNNAGWARA